MKDELRRMARRYARYRVLTKLRIARRYDAPLRRALRYALTDPEIDSFSYEIRNEHAFLEALHELTGHDLAPFTAELRADTALAGVLARHRIPDLRRPPALGGYRSLLYGLVRAQRPALVIETGILHGLTSLVLLRALERNGHGELWSFDVDPRAGALVPAGARSRWRIVLGDTARTLDAELQGRTVDVFIQDSLTDDASQRREFGTVLPHLRDGALLVAVNGWSPALEELSAGRPYVRLAEQAVHPVYPGGTLGFAKWAV